MPSSPSLPLYELLSVAAISASANGVPVLNKVTFAQLNLQKIAIAGETGSGKSTLMKIIGGLGQADTGSVHFEGKAVKGVNDRLMPGHAGIAYLSQSFELSNNYRVEEVLAYANVLTEKESLELYAVCRVGHLLKRITNTLSGGERQRVALARLLTLSPRLLLLDEPFSNMDLIHKNILKDVIDEVTERLGITCMLVSHLPDDILPWADELIVLRKGSIIRQGPPKEIYNDPENDYTAGLLGRYTALTPALAHLFDTAAGPAVFIRPEQFIIVEKQQGIRFRVLRVLFLGGCYEIQAINAEQIIWINTIYCDIKIDDIIYIRMHR